MRTNNDILLSKRIVLGRSNGKCERLYSFLADALAQLPVTLEFRHDIKLAAEELLANIINHGYAEDTEATVELELTVDSHSVHLTFTDSCSAFDPLERAIPDTLNDLSQGGVGLLLVKSLTDEQHYERIGDRNVFTVTKNYNKKKPE